MRVFLINYEYPPLGAGAANATFNTAKALVALGHVPVVATTAFDAQRGYTDENGVHVYRLKALRKHANKSNILEMASYMLSLVWKLRSIVKLESPDCAIIFFSFPCGPIGLLLRWFFNIPYVISLRGGDVPGTEEALKRIYWLLTPLRRLVFRNSSGVIANSKGLAQLSESADPYLVKVIPNGVDTEFWLPGGQYTFEHFSILFVGRFHWQKNLHFLLKQFARYCDTDSRATLTLVGDGPDRESLEMLARELKIEQKITWRPWSSKEELRLLYQAASCVVNPSLYEGMPNVLLEAMACGVPVLASDSTGNNEVIESGKTGYLFQLDDAEDFLTKLTSLRNDREKVHKMQVAARDTMVRKFSWLSVTEQYIALFTHV